MKSPNIGDENLPDEQKVINIAIWNRWQNLFFPDLEWVENIPRNGQFVVENGVMRPRLAAKTIGL